MLGRMRRRKGRAGRGGSSKAVEKNSRAVSVIRWKPKVSPTVRKPVRLRSTVAPSREEDYCVQSQ